MFIEISISIIALIIGLLFLAPFVREDNRLLLVATSWFIGWVALCCAQIVCLFFGISATLGNTALVLVIILMLNWHFHYHKADSTIETWHVNLINNLKPSSPYVVMCMLLIITVVLTARDNVKSAPDVHQYEAVSVIFHNIGIVANSIANAGIVEMVVGARLPLMVSSSNIVKQLGHEWHFTLPMLSGLFLMLGMLGIWNQKENKFPFISSLFFFLIPVVLINNHNIKFHLGFLHSNWMTACYFTLGALMLTLYMDNRKSIWLFIGCILLGATALLRKEMLVISLVPLAFLVTYCHVPPKLKALALMIFLAVSTAWHIWGNFVLTDYGSLFTTSGHGGGVYSLIPIIGVALLILIPFWRIGQERAFFLSLGLLVSSVFILYFCSGSFQATAAQFAQLLFDNRYGRWVGLWVPITLSFLCFLVVYLIYFLNKKNPSRINLKQGIRELSFTFNCIIYSLFIILIIYTVFEDPLILGFGYSGNRVMVHFVPLAMWFTVSLMLYLWNNATGRERDTTVESCASN